MPILDCVLFGKDGDNFTLTGSDTENVLTVILNTVILQEGDFQMFCINARQLKDIVSQLSEQTLAFTIGNDYTITVDYENGQFQVAGANPAEYPQKMQVTKENRVVAFSVDRKEFVGSLSAAVTCIDYKVDGIRPVMNCVWLDIKEDGYVVVGSDGHKLCKESHTPGAPFLADGGATQILLPAPCVKMIASAFEKAEKIDIEADNNNVHMTSPEASLLMSTVEGQMPSYNAAIPNDNPNHILVDVKSFKAAFKRVKLFASMSSQLVRIAVKGNSLISLKAEDLDFATQSEETVTCDEVSAPNNFQIGVRGDFFLQELDLVATEKVRLLFSDPSRAMIMREEDPNSTMVLLIMPLLFND